MISSKVLLVALCAAFASATNYRELSSSPLPSGVVILSTSMTAPVPTDPRASQSSPSGSSSVVTTTSGPVPSGSSGTAPSSSSNTSTNAAPTKRAQYGVLAGAALPVIVGLL